MSQTTSALPHSFNTRAELPSCEQLVAKDLRQIRLALDHLGREKAALFQTSVFRSVLHIAFDGTCLFAALWAVILWGCWAVPASLLVIGNRQRALGNVLHDLGHRN